jgi:hypothetical protein
MSSAPATEGFAAKLAAWRQVPAGEQRARFAAIAPAPEVELRLAMMAETCPCGTGPCGCGSGPPRSCGHPDRPSEVRRADCLACVAREWWEGAVDPAW